MDVAITDSIYEFDNPAPPPGLLYKYLSPRLVVNVLEECTLRVTPLSETNDPFEVRPTFNKFAGPRFVKMLEEAMDARVGAFIAERLPEEGHTEPTDEVVRFVRATIEQQLGCTLKAALRAQMQTTMESELLPTLNNPSWIQTQMESIGRNLFFALSEQPDSANMWAHYADNHSGLVLAFRTDHMFFTLQGMAQNTSLWKVKYLDGKVDELLSDVHAALISKTTEWANEKEWRVYETMEHVARTVGSSDDPIHLVIFPTSVVERVIVGRKATKVTIGQIRRILAAKYDGVPLYQMQADPYSHRLLEVRI